MTLGHKLTALLAATMWGMNTVVIKTAVLVIPATVFNSLRFALILPLAFLFKRPFSYHKLITLAVLLNVINFTTFGIALERGSGAGLMTLLHQSSVFFAIMASIILNNDKPKMNEIIGICISFVGVYFLLKSKLQMGEVDVISVLLLLVASISNGVGLALLRKFKAQSSVSMAIWLGALTFPFMLGFALFDNSVPKILTHLQDVDLKIIALVSFASYGAGILAIGLWCNLLKQYSPSTVGGFSLFIVPVTMVCSIIVMDESFSPEQILSIFVCLLGIIVTQSKNLNSVFEKITGRARERKVGA